MDILFIKTPNEKAFKLGVKKFTEMGFKKGFEKADVDDGSECIYAIPSKNIFSRISNGYNNEYSISSMPKIGKYLTYGFYENGMTSTRDTVTNMKEIELDNDFNYGNNPAPQTIEMYGHTYARIN